jgi:uncharacterized protein YdaU (DUF1376 family)
VTISDRTTAPQKSPAFQFYPGDYLSSSRVQRMSMTERGVYITLLSFQWLDGSLPSNLLQLAQMVGVRPPQFERMWKNGPLHECFATTDTGRLVNERLESERSKQRAFRDRQAQNGSKGGRTTKGSQSQTEPTANPPLDSGLVVANPPQSQTQARALKTEEERRSASLEIERNVFDGQVAFKALVDAYPPNRISTGHRTQSRFNDIVFATDAPDQTFARMLENLANHNRSHEWRIKGMAPNLYRWLDEGLWERVMDEQAPAAERVTVKTNRTLAAAAELLNRRPA